MPTDKDFNFGGENTESTPIVNTQQFSDENFSSDTLASDQSTEPTSFPSKGNRLDASTINVEITDQESPIVILFGPSMCGKTMTLVRLTRYLSKKYKFIPDKSFKDANDSEYEVLCRNFNSAVDSDNAADGTRYIDFMLLRVDDTRGKTLCQFVESPGEFLFDPGKKDEAFPAYFETIRGSKNRKIWVFFLEPTLSRDDKKAYVRKITEDIVFGEEDRFIFLVNKIDMPVTKRFMTSMEKIDKDGLRKYVEQEFGGLLECEKFIVHRMFLGDKEKFKLVGFQTGTYKEGKDKDGNNYKTFQAGHDSHPRRLWEAIEGAVIGDW